MAEGRRTLLFTSLSFPIHAKQTKETDEKESVRQFSPHDFFQ
jgi:hypothetical protein